MRQGTLLVVDNEIHITRIVVDLLKDKIEKILIAENGSSALEILKTEQIHCVLTDIAMPVMDGLTFARNARILGHHIPFIFYSGQKNRKNMALALMYNAYDFIEKPSLNELEEVVVAAMDFALEKFHSGSFDETLSSYEKFCRSNQ